MKITPKENKDLRALIPIVEPSEAAGDTLRRPFTGGLAAQDARVGLPRLCPKAISRTDCETL